jgi:hypothetical protein
VSVPLRRAWLKVLPWPASSVVLLAGLTLVSAACAVTSPSPPAWRAGSDVAVSRFAFEQDTFAFPNEIRARHAGRPDLYANYCFVLARGLRQFAQFARFAPEEPRLDRQGYVARIRDVVARPPWHPALPADERVVIPGYANLREFSRAEEAAVKAALGGRFWTWMHWTNWRVTFRVSPEHQQGVLHEIGSELAAGRLVQLLVTNWPIPELNHTVVAYALDARGPDAVLTVWDPNDPARPGTITWNGHARRFDATDVYDTRPGPIRVFRMYYSPWL